MGLLSLKPSDDPPPDLHQLVSLDPKGEGEFGRVFLCEHPNTGERVAVKKLCFETLLHSHKSWLTPEKILEEVELNSKLINKEGIVQFHAYWVVGQNASEILNGTHEFPKHTSSGPGPSSLDNCNFLLIQMEFCEATLGSLLDNSTKLHKLELEDVLQQQPIKFSLAQLSEGLYEIHKAGIIHRDIHPGNIFLKMQHGRFRWKIGDFGLSREWIPEEKSSKKGCELYRSPEMARGDRNYSFPTDVFSLGLVALLLLDSELRRNHRLRNLTFRDLRTNPSEWEPGTNPIVDAGVNIPKELQEEWNIVQRMLEYDVKKRIDLGDALQRFGDPSNILYSLNIIQTDCTFTTHFPLSRPFAVTSNNFVGREEEISKVTSLITQDNREKDVLHLVSITGPASVGKTELAQQILIEVEKMVSWVWIDCADVVKKWTDFLNHGYKMSEKWIIIFDDVRKENEGVVRLMIEALTKLPHTIKKPRAILLTTSENCLEMEGTAATEVQLEFDWVTATLSKNPVPRFFLRGIVREIIKSLILGGDSSLRETCTGLFELVGKIETLLVPTFGIPAVWSAVFNLYLLVGYLNTEAVKKTEFIYYLSQMSGTSFEICSKVLESFCQGVLRETIPELDEATTEEKILKDTLIILTRLTPICSKTMLRHPLVLFILRNVLTDIYEGDLEIAFFKRVLRTYRNVKEKGQLSRIVGLNQTISWKHTPAIILHEELDRSYAEEVAIFARDANDYKSLQNLYARYLNLYGVIGKPTLTLSDILTCVPSYQEDYPGPNILLQYTINEYIGYVQNFGSSNEETLFSGGFRYLQKLKVHSKNTLLDRESHFVMCIAIYLSLEEYLVALEDVEETPTGKIKFKKEKEIFKCLLLLADAFNYLRKGDPEATMAVCAVVLAFTDNPDYVERVHKILNSV